MKICGSAFRPLTQQLNRSSWCVWRSDNKPDNVSVKLLDFNALAGSFSAGNLVALWIKPAGFVVGSIVVMTLAACTSTHEHRMHNTSRLKQLNGPAPIAAQKPFSAQYHGRTLSDPYHWLHDKNYPEVEDEEILDYLKAENAYFENFLAPHATLVKKIFNEFKGRIDEVETSVPFVKNGYEYRWFYRPGEEYRTYSRKNLATDEDTIFLDETALAQGHDYFVLGDWDVSQDNRYLVYSIDTTGDERYKVKIKDLRTDKYLPDQLDDVQGDVRFAVDERFILYALLEKDKWLAKTIKVHEVGSKQQHDKTLYHETDDGFFIGFEKTSSGEYFIITVSQGEVQESYALPSNALFSTPVKLVSREAGFSQSIDHAHGNFYILANDLHKNFRLVKVSDTAPNYHNWETLIMGSDHSYLIALQTFEGFIALKSRDNGYENIRIRDYRGNEHKVAFAETIFTADIGTNVEFKQSFLRLNYESMITPKSVLDYDLAGKALITRKVQRIPSGYDKNRYVSKRVMATARDGTSLPISIVYKKGYRKNGHRPMVLTGYGAYGLTISPGFSITRLPLLDRGFAFAIAHVRGGAMMGYQWYLDGKLEKRTNTFNDFVDAARYLIEENYVTAGNISISGRSAGGELMGAAVLQAPELWRSVTLGVPFVDVLNTMLDASLPLTPPEWKEWGNPIDSARAYDLIKSYSPFDNIEQREYPPMLVTGGLYDPRVTYWEPAKWTAKMRHNKTDDNLIVMRINMGAGHFKNSGRYGRLKDSAEEYAFILLAHGITR